MSIFRNVNMGRMKRLLEIILLFAVIPLVIFVLIKAGLYFAPFVIALLISMLLEPVIRFGIRKIKLKRRFAALISLLLFLSTIGSLAALLIIRLITEIKSLYNMIDYYYSSLNAGINKIVTEISNIYSWLPAEVTDNLGSIFADASKFVIDVLNKFVKGIVSTAVSMPQVFLFIIVTILSSYFLASDRDRVYLAIRRHLPVSWQVRMQSIRNDMFSALFGYIRSQLILMSITFVELGIGFTIIGFSQPLLFALLISIFDALPIFGIGGILVPWTAYLFISGSTGQGIGLAVLYIIVIAVRQLIEPKVLGKQIGIHPLLTLLAMYTGMKVMGVPGLIVGPVTMLIFKNILTGFMKGRTMADILDGKIPTAESAIGVVSNPDTAIKTQGTDNAGTGVAEAASASKSKNIPAEGNKPAAGEKLH